MTSVDIYPTWHPDGTTIAHKSSRDVEGTLRPGIYITVVATREKSLLIEQQHVPIPTGVSHLAWSPDGQRIVFEESGQIWTVRIADRVVERWSDPARRSRGPSWSADGQWLLFSHFRSGAEHDTLGGLRAVNVSTRESRAMLHNDSIATVIRGPARLSPDGSRLTFVATARGREGPTSSVFEVFTMSWNGGDFQRLTTLYGDANNPQWLDEDRIIFDFGPACDTGISPVRETWIVDVSGAVERWSADLGDSRVQFGYPFAIGHNATPKVAFIGLDSTGTSGVLHVQNLDGSGRTQLGRPWQ